MGVDSAADTQTCFVLLNLSQVAGFGSQLWKAVQEPDPAGPRPANWIKCSPLHARPKLLCVAANKSITLRGDTQLPIWSSMYHAFPKSNCSTLFFPPFFSFYFLFQSIKKNRLLLSYCDLIALDCRKTINSLSV